MKELKFYDFTFGFHHHPVAWPLALLDHHQPQVESWSCWGDLADVELLPPPTVLAPLHPKRERERRGEERREREREREREMW